MEFRQFLETDYQSFTCCGASIIITEMPMAFHEIVLLEEVDAELLNFIQDRVKHFSSQVTAILGKPPAALATPPDPESVHSATPRPPVIPPMKKFRVEIKYPRNMKGLKLGHFHPEVMYVFANDAREAKTKAHQYVQTKLEPKEGDKYRRFNYLKGLKMKVMEPEASHVTSWSGLTNMVKHLAKTTSGLTPLRYLGEPEMRVFLKQAKKKSFEEDMKSLEKKEQRILKTFYFHMAQNPQLSPETRLLMDDDMARKMRKLSTKKLAKERLPGDDEEIEQSRGDWKYWSVFEPKSEEEENQIWMNIHDRSDLFKAAARYGIGYKDLRHVRDELWGSKIEHENAMRKMWREIKHELNGVHKFHNNSRIARESDYNNPDLANKYGVHWDEFVHNWMTGANGQDNEYFPFRDDGDPDNTKNVSEAADWLWEFYKDGLPPKTPAIKQWKDSLEYLLDYRRKVKSGQSENDDVPF